MIGFLLKIAIVAGIVVGLGYYVQTKYGRIPHPEEFVLGVKDEISKVDVNNVGKNISSSLDALVANKSSTSPVVLGVKITNDSLSTVVDTIQKLPPDQVNQIKSAICAPLPTPTAIIGQ